jgi:uncharacterized protein (DUF2267 family)
MDYDEVIGIIQQEAGGVSREGTAADEVELFETIFEHVRAVFATLAEAITTEEWLDITVELPEEYFGLLPAV